MNEAENRENPLVQALRTGSPEAVAEVRERIGRIVRFRGYRIPKDEQKEIEQEIVVQVWQAVNRSSFDPQAGFWGFVEVVTVRRCIDWLRRRRPESTLEADFSGPTDGRPGPLGTTLDHERTQLAYAALAQLGKPCRDLIYLHVGMGRSYKEIGTLLDKSEGALRVQMYRCVREARRIVEQLASPRAAKLEEKEEG